MEKKVKISPFQLLILLVISRMFTVMTYMPAGSSNNISITTIPFSALLQFLVILFSFKICQTDRGCSPLLIQGKGAKVMHTIIVVIYWILVLLCGVMAAINFTHLLVSVFYEFRQAFWVMTIFVLSSGIAVSQGLESFARAAVIFGLMLLIGVIAIVVGLWKEYSWLNFVVPRLQINESIRGIYQGFAMNFEMVAILLLLPYVGTGQPQKSLAGWWIGIVAVASEGIIFMLMFALGGYGANLQFPVFEAASLARLMVFQHLDAVFIALWVVMGVSKLAVYLFLASELWGELLRKEPRAVIIWFNIGVMLVLGILCLFLPKLAENIYSLASYGLITVVGVLLLPIVGWLTRKVGNKRR